MSILVKLTFALKKIKVELTYYLSLIYCICLDPDEKPALASNVSFFFLDACGLHCSGDIMHYSQNPQPLYSEKNIKNGSTALFTYLKIILLQCF